MKYREFNFDGLVGPTHNYAGLSYGNVASDKNKASPSSPKKAALQGLKKAKSLADMGFPQAILPPHERPAVRALRAWGFDGTSDAKVIETVAKEAPHLLAAASSASAMWTANACTMAPSCDTTDQRAHFTPANLFGNLHRSLEGSFTQTVLQAIFKDPSMFCVHPPLEGGEAMADEGAANHTRLAASTGKSGLHLFVYGRSALDSSLPAPKRFPARQTLESVQAIARLHALRKEQALFIQQSPEAIDAGVFHNDVISVGSGNALLYHEMAFHEGQRAIEALSSAFAKTAGGDLILLPVSSEEVSIKEAVRTYLFNSQLLCREDGSLIIVTPGECRESDSVSQLLDKWVEDRNCPVSEVLTFDLRESMRNGGGPACLRQRIVLSEDEVTALGGRVILDDSLYADLADWIEKHYRDSLHPNDLADSSLLEESRNALDELTSILKLPNLYPFQS